MSNKTAIAANRSAWNASAEQHRCGADWRRLIDGFARPGFHCLDAVDLEAVDRLVMAGKDVAQICCNNGRELLSLRNLGAARCVGFDQADAFLQQGRELAAVAGHGDVEFVSGDVHAIPSDYDSSFDIVVVTIGVFGWMPDVAGFVAIVARLLRPGGMFYVHEEHPVMNMFDPAAERPFEPVLSYFREQPEITREPLVYDGTGTGEVGDHYWFFHTLADIMSACLDNGLAITRFREYPDNISTVELDVYQAREARLPMSYTLFARKGMA